MIVRVTRKGGYAGIEETIGSIDVKSLGPGQEQRVKNTLAALAGRGSEVGADMIQYDIEVIGDQGEHSRLVVTDDGAPDNPVHELLEILGSRE